MSPDCLGAPLGERRFLLFQGRRDLPMKSDGVGGNDYRPTMVLSISILRQRGGDVNSFMMQFYAFARDCHIVFVGFGEMKTPVRGGRTGVGQRKGAVAKWKFCSGLFFRSKSRKKPRICGKLSANLSVFCIAKPAPAHRLAPNVEKWIQLFVTQPKSRTNAFAIALCPVSSRAFSGQMQVLRRIALYECSFFPA